MSLQLFLWNMMFEWQTLLESGDLPTPACSDLYYASEERAVSLRCSLVSLVCIIPDFLYFIHVCTCTLGHSIMSAVDGAWWITEWVDMHVHVCVCALIMYNQIDRFDKIVFWGVFNCNRHTVGQVCTVYMHVITSTTVSLYSWWGIMKMVARLALTLATWSMHESPTLPLKQHRSLLPSAMPQNSVEQPLDTILTLVLWLPAMLCSQRISTLLQFVSSISYTLTLTFCGSCGILLPTILLPVCSSELFEPTISERWLCTAAKYPALCTLLVGVQSECGSIGQSGSD